MMHKSVSDPANLMKPGQDGLFPIRIDFKDSLASTDKAVHKPPPKDPSNTAIPPIMRLPTEIRAKIFRYLLPNKQKHIEPTSIVKEQMKLEMEQNNKMLSRVQERARIQHGQTNDLLKHSSFYGTFDPFVHSTRFRAPFSADSFEMPTDFSVESFRDVYAMPEIRSFDDDDEITWSPSTASSPLTKKPSSASLEEMFGPIIWLPSSTSSEQQSITFINPLTKEEIIKLTEAIHADQYDAVPVNMTLNLMTTCPHFATEISTILYEEYTFEIHVHVNGIDFLHLPRTLLYEYNGTKLAENMTAFQEQGHFCLQRMRHLSFVLFGGDSASRTATWRMRKNVEDLVGMVGDLASLDVEFDGEAAFWKVNERVRMGTADVSVVEMVCAPFVAGLSDVGKVAFKVPPSLTENEGLLEWRKSVEGRVMGSKQTVQDEVWEMKEAAMFEATMEWEYRQAFREGNRMEDYALMDEMEMEMEDEDEENGDEDEDEMSGDEDMDMDMKYERRRFLDSPQMDSR